MSRTAIALAAQRPDLVAAEQARRSFREFVRQAWPLVEPSTPLVWGWYLDAICLHLEEFARGRIKWLVINIPPRHLKTSLASVLWPAWVWTWCPSWRLFAATYAQRLTNDAAQKCRALVESPWYRERFASVDGWELAHDSNRVDYYKTSAGGHRFSTSVEAGTTGYGGDDLIFDDLINVADTHSEAAREASARWIDNTIATRRNDPRTGGAVVIAQRLHEHDPVGHILGATDGDKWQVLRLPTEYDPVAPTVTHRLDGSELWRDPRTQAGELLHPARFGPAEVAAAKVTLGAYNYAAQHDQRPAPAGGGMFQRGWWRWWKPDGKAPDHGAHRPEGCYTGPAEPLPELDRLVISVDATFKGLDQAVNPDPVSITVVGAAGARRFVLDRVHRQMDLSETIVALVGLIARWPKAKRRLIEAAANGPAILSTLSRHIQGLIAVDPVGPKEARAWAIQPQVQAGNVYLPDGAPWAADVVAEFASFPRGRHDDDVDSIGQALRDLDDPSEAERYLAALGQLDPERYVRALRGIR